MLLLELDVGAFERFHLLAQILDLCIIAPMRLSSRLTILKLEDLCPSRACQGFRDRVLSVFVVGEISIVISYFFPSSTSASSAPSSPLSSSSFATSIPSLLFVALEINVADDSTR